jgi:hypothetical protein
MLKTLKLAALLSLLALSSAGCSALSFLQPTATPTSTSTSTPTLTPTFTPTNTPTPTNTKEPECNADQVLENLRDAVEYDKFQVFHQFDDAKSTLVLWFMDPNLDPEVSEVELIYGNVGIAIVDTLVASQKLKTTDACTTKLFDDINVIVTDSEYNGWLSALISMSDLPDTVRTDQASLENLAGKLTIDFYRESPPEKPKKAPKDSCTWDESHENILLHFPPEENMAYFLVRDDFGTNVWAQWVTTKEYLEPNLLSSLMNISMELSCLHPAPDQLIFIIVDEKGKMLAFGLWDGKSMKAQDLSQVLVDIK